MQKFTFIDLFAGIGGFRLALENLGGECVFSSEWDKDAQHTYQLNFEEKPKGDITAIPARDIPNHDILCAGFPCQAFSISGKQLGFADTRGTLFFEIQRIIHFHKPKAVILENVKNLKSHDKGKTYSTIEKALISEGYQVYHKIISGTDFGVPQDRKRIFIVAVHKTVGKAYQFPKPTGCSMAIVDILSSGKSASKYRIKRPDIVIPKSRSKKSIKPLRCGHLGKGGQGERIYSPKGVGITLSAYGGGAGAKTGLYYIGKTVRKLSPRECARVSGYPDTFVLHPNDRAAWKQFGNTVIPPVVRAVAKEVLKLLV